MVDLTIPARHRKAALIGTGKTIRHYTAEFMPMEHTRSFLRRLMQGVGDSLVTNHRRPILTVLDDTSRDAHDELLVACDR
jgi:hypothetical protein